MASSFESIVVDIAKLRDYCLSDAHPRGRHKARVFRSSIGLTVADAEFLRNALLNAAQSMQDRLRRTDADQYGQRYVLDFPMATGSGYATIRSTWIVLAGQNVLRFISCYVL